MRKTLFFVLLLMPLSLKLWASPPSDISPETIAGSTKIDAEQLIELVDKTPDLVIVDSRIPGDRKQGFIEGSVSLPDIDTHCDSLSRHIPDKTSPVLFYCNGIKCGRSGRAVRIAVDCGYSRVYWFRGGFQEWLNKGYPYLQE